MIAHIDHSVRRERQFSDLITNLRGASESSDLKAFGTIKDIMSFSAFYALEKKIQPKILASDVETIGTAEYFKDTDNIAAIVIVAIAANSKDEAFSILRPENQKKMIEIFEQYANAGLAEINEIYIRNNFSVLRTMKYIVLSLMPEDDVEQVEVGSVNILG